MISKRSIFFLVLILMPFVMAACSSASSSLGQYHEGRILLLNVLEMERTDELLYSTIDPEDVIRKWRIKPSKAGQELLLMRFKVENHVAVNTVLVADEQSVVIEGFFQNDYRPISVNRTVVLDQRGQRSAPQFGALVVGIPSWGHILAAVLGLLGFVLLLQQKPAKASPLVSLAIVAIVAIVYVVLFTPALNLREKAGDVQPQPNASVDVADGQCTVHPRIVVNVGTNVHWNNNGNIDSTIQFGPGVLPELGAELLKMAPGESISHRFDEPGTFNYECSGGDAELQTAQVVVEPADMAREHRENNILFLEGSFNLPRGTSLDGWMVFDIPEGTEIKNLRWRAGDSITVRF
ncbi:MAG: hypothetical protein MK158_04255 [Dehalococcoidia bacterium]|nr:hypothetical protein [Dehalococcoidia bacterium]